MLQYREMNGQHPSLRKLVKMHTCIPWGHRTRGFVNHVELKRLSARHWQRLQYDVMRVFFDATCDNDNLPGPSTASLYVEPLRLRCFSTRAKALLTGSCQLQSSSKLSPPHPNSYPLRQARGRQPRVSKSVIPDPTVTELCVDRNGCHVRSEH